MSHQFYVYCLFRPWNGEPCYIGKGQGDRAWYHEYLGPRHYNRHLAAVFRKARGPIPVVLLHEGLDEVTALEYERAFILALGRCDQGKGPLCNRTDGGDGVTGLRHTADSRAKIARAQEGKPLTERHRASCVKAQNAPKQRAIVAEKSAAWWASLDDAAREAQRQKIGAAVKSQWDMMTPEQREVRRQSVRRAIIAWHQKRKAA